MSSAVLNFRTDRRKVSQPGCIPRTLVQLGTLSAEIIADRRGRPPILTCVGRKHGSPGILFFGQFHSLQEAETAAAQFVNGHSNGRQPRSVYCVNGELAALAVSVNQRVRDADSLVDASNRLLGGARELIRQSRELLNRDCHFPRTPADYFRSLASVNVDQGKVAANEVTSYVACPKASFSEFTKR